MFRRLLPLLLMAGCALAASPKPSESASRTLATENVVLVMTDGLRWQELFRGADPALLNKENGGVKDLPALKARYWREETAARREVLMPFVWSTFLRQGQLWGNRDRSSSASVTNGMNFSYPGYNETLAGFGDPGINSNAKRNNPNVTVLEWLHGKPSYAGKVAAVTAWDVFPWILNRERARLTVNSGFEPLEGVDSPTLKLLNRLKTETPSHWDVEPADSLTFHTGMEYLKLRKPRVLFLSLGETDEWAHHGNYDQYLDAAHRVDAYLKELWETLQSMRQYRGKTTLIFTTDHGRGDAPKGWMSHGAAIPGSENIWMGFLGPDTPATGEQSSGKVTQSQVASTLAAFLGEDYRSAQPKAAAPVDAAFRSR